MLPLTFDISYNGFSFPGSTRSNIQAHLIYDPADRVVTAVKYIVTLTCVVHNAGGVSADMLDLEKRLSKPGQQFTYQSNGSSGLTVNVSSARDALWGPKPRLIVLRQIGGTLAYEISWRCEVTIPRCDAAQFEKEIMAFTFEANISTDTDGYTTRTISGELEIPMTRVAGRSFLPDSVDNYWEKAVPVIPRGFTRVSRERTISADKRKLNFTIVDQQLPGGGLPVGVTQAHGQHSISSSMPNIFQYMSNLTATYVVPPGTPKSKASEAFYLLLLDRANRSAGPTKGRIFTGFSVNEGLYSSREISFSASWTYFSTLADCMVDGGIFRSMPGNEWTKWAESVSEAHSPRGPAGMRIAPEDDSLIGLCEDGTSILRTRPAVERKLVSRPRPNPPPCTISPEFSWLRAQFWLRIEVEHGLVRHKTLPTKPVKPADIGQVNVLQNAPGRQGALQNGGRQAGGIIGMLEGIFGANNDGRGRLVNQQAPSSDVVQYRTGSTWIATLTGFVMRAQFKIPVPELILIGDVKPVPKKQTISEAVVAVWSGIPINGARFELEYWFDKEPTGAKVQIPGNPALFVPAQ